MDYQPHKQPLNPQVQKRFTAEKSVLKGNGTEVAEADGVPLAFKMKTYPQSFALKRNYQAEF